MVPIVTPLAAETVFAISPYHLLALGVLLVVLIVLRAVLRLGTGLPALVLLLSITYVAGSVSLVPGEGSGPLAITLAAAALLLSIWLSLQGWLHCRRVWLTEPHRLLEEPRPPSLLTSIATLLALAAAWFCLGATASWIASVAALLAGIAACTAGHVAARTWTGGIGMWIIALGIALLFRAGGWPGAFGLVLGAAFLLWMANFWHQQLHDGVPWTTAGRLIPWSRAGAALLAAIAVPLLPSVPDLGWSGPFTLLAALGLALLLFRDGWSGRHHASAAAAWLLSGAVAIGVVRWLAPDLITWILPQEPDGDVTQAALARTGAFAFGPLLLSLRRLGRHEPVTATANILLLPLLAGVEFISTGISPMAFWGLVPLLILELLTNRPPSGALAETAAASSNP